MSEIMVFSIPAAGHMHPLMPVVKELVERGYHVTFYGFKVFQEKIEATGASYIECDSWMPTLEGRQKKQVQKSQAVALTIQDLKITYAIDPFLNQEVERIHPNLIISDSVCLWGKLIAKKNQIPFLCSTTTFAFNEYSSNYKKEAPAQILSLAAGMPAISKQLRKLDERGYHERRILDLIQNDNQTYTLVYTTKSFQPFADTFDSEYYCFCGPSLFSIPQSLKEEKSLIYISLGTVVNDQFHFFQECIRAFENQECHVIISCGDKIDLSKLKVQKSSIEVFPYVNQLDILSRADLFITHAGMNSVNESLYYGVPMLLVPVTGEQKAVARRVQEIGCGKILKNKKAKAIAAAALEVANSEFYAENARNMRLECRKAPAAQTACDFIKKKLLKTVR